VSYQCLNHVCPTNATATLVQQSLRRLIQDIYSLDVKGRFREYALAEDSWAAAVSFLDENNGAGWEVLEVLLGSNSSNSNNSDSDSGSSSSNSVGAAMQSLTIARSVLAMPFFANVVKRRRSQ
jgi:hypothetical protein